MQEMLYHLWRNFRAQPPNCEEISGPIANFTSKFVKKSTKQAYHFAHLNWQATSVTQAT